MTTSRPPRAYDPLVGPTRAAENHVLCEWEAHFSGVLSGLPSTFARSIAIFVRRGLRVADLQYALDRAWLKFQANKQTMTYEEAWRYFCGVCWGLLKDRAACPICQGRFYFGCSNHGSAAIDHSPRPHS